MVQKNVLRFQVPEKKKKKCQQYRDKNKDVQGVMWKWWYERVAATVSAFPQCRMSSYGLPCQNRINCPKYRLRAGLRMVGITMWASDSCAFSDGSFCVSSAIGVISIRTHIHTRTHPPAPVPTPVPTSHVPVYNIQTVYMFQRQYDLGGVETGTAFREFAEFSEMKKKFATSAVIQNEK